MFIAFLRCIFNQGRSAGIAIHLYEMRSFDGGDHECGLVTLANERELPGVVNNLLAKLLDGVGRHFVESEEEESAFSDSSVVTSACCYYRVNSTFVELQWLHGR